jgi:hypothetical protein
LISSKDVRAKSKVESTPRSSKDSDDQQNSVIDQDPKIDEIRPRISTGQTVPYSGALLERYAKEAENLGHVKTGAFLGRFIDKWKQSSFSEALSRLEELSLIEDFELREDGFYHASFHPLIRDWIRIRTDKIAGHCRKYSSIAATAILLRLADIGGRNIRDMYLLPRLQVLAHVQAMLSNQKYWFESEDIFPDHKTQAGYSEYLIGILFDANGDLDAAEFWIKEAYTQRQHRLGPENAPLYLANRLAAVLLQKRNPKAVEDLLLPLVKTHTDLPATNMIDLQNSYNYLAQALEEQGNYVDAEITTRRILRARQILLGHDHECTLENAMHLARLLYLQNKNEEALKLSEEVLRITQIHNQQRGVVNEISLIDARHAVCVGLYQLSRFARAEEMTLRNLEEEGKYRGKAHPSVLPTRMLLAGIYSKTGRLSDAEKLLREVLMFRQTQFGQSHPDSLGAMIELAALMETQGNLEVAKAIYTTTIKRMQATLGEGHIKALETIRLFALLLERHQQYKDATK